MKLSMRPNRKIRIAHDNQLGFAIYAQGAEITIRAKEHGEPDCHLTSIVVGRRVEIESEQPED